MRLGGSQNLLLAEPPPAVQATLPSGEEEARGGALAAVSQSPRGRRGSGALQTVLAVLCPVLVHSPHSCTMNRERQLSPQSHEERTAADGSCLPVVTTEPQEKL